MPFCPSILELNSPATPQNHRVTFEATRFWCYHFSPWSPWSPSMNSYKSYSTRKRGCTQKVEMTHGDQPSSGQNQRLCKLQAEIQPLNFRLPKPLEPLVRKLLAELVIDFDIAKWTVQLLHWRLPVGPCADKKWKTPLTVHRVIPHIPSYSDIYLICVGICNLSNILAFHITYVRTLAS